MAWALRASISRKIRRQLSGNDALEVILEIQHVDQDRPLEAASQNEDAAIIFAAIGQAALRARGDEIEGHPLVQSDEFIVDRDPSGLRRPAGPGHDFSR